MNDNVHPTPPPLQETERDRWNYDVGYEDGHKAGNPDDLLDRVRAVLQEFITELDDFLGEDKQ